MAKERPSPRRSPSPSSNKLHARRHIRPLELPLSTHLPQSSTAPDLRVMFSPLSASTIGMQFAQHQQLRGTHEGAPPASPSTPSAVSQSPTANVSSVASRRRAHGLLNVFKSKDRPNSSQRPRSPHRPADASPLPSSALISPKAARLLGVQVGEQDDTEDEDSDTPVDQDGKPGPPVWQSLRKRASLPFLTQKQDSTEKRSRFAGNVLEEPKRSAANTAKHRPFDKALQMLGIPANATRPKTSKDSTITPEERTPALMYRPSGADQDDGYDSDGGLERRGNKMQRNSQTGQQGRRRIRKRARIVDHMPSITEASVSSHSDHGFLHGDGDGAELEVITEYYRHDEGTQLPGLQRSFTTPGLVPHYSPNNHDLSQTQYAEPSDEQDVRSLIRPLQSHPSQGTAKYPFGFDHQKRSDGYEIVPMRRIPNIESQPQIGNPPPTRIPTQLRNAPQTKIPPQVHSPLQQSQFKKVSPLQARENACIDDIKRINEQDSQRVKIDAAAKELKDKHAEFLSAFEELRARSKSELGAIQESISSLNLDRYIGDSASAACALDEDSIIDSIDSDEEPEVCIATVVVYTSVKPSDIKEEDWGTTRSDTHTSSQRQGIARPERSTENASQSHALKQSRPHTNPSLQARESKQSKRNGMIDMSFSTNFSQFKDSENKRASISQEQAQAQVHKLATTTTHTAHRPPSLGSHRNVPAVQNENDPPRPPQKDYKHHCIQGGHIFSPTNMKHVPDNVEINELGVRPYIHTPTGAKQHIHVPIPCEDCGKDVNEEPWGCDVPVCRLQVCHDCAVRMQMDSETRAVESHSRG